MVAIEASWRLSEKANDCERPRISGDPGTHRAFSSPGGPPAQTGDESNKLPGSRFRFPGRDRPHAARSSRVLVPTPCRLCGDRAADQCLTDYGLQSSSVRWWTRERRAGEEHEREERLDAGKSLGRSDDCNPPFKKPGARK